MLTISFGFDEITNEWHMLCLPKVLAVAVSSLIKQKLDLVTSTIEAKTLFQKEDTIEIKDLFEGETHRIAKHPSFSVD